VDHGVPVRVRESVGDLDGIAHGLLERNRATFEPARQRFPSSSSIAKYSMPSSRPASSTRQMCGCSRLVLRRRSRSKRGCDVASCSNPFGDGLQRDEAVEMRIERAIHFAHSARREVTDHLVAAQPRAGTDSHRYSPPFNSP
jgi:hypothetical protein